MTVEVQSNTSVAAEVDYRQPENLYGAVGAMLQLGEGESVIAQRACEHEYFDGQGRRVDGPKGVRIYYKVASGEGVGPEREYDVFDGQDVIQSGALQVLHEAAQARSPRGREIVHHTYLW